MKFLYLVTSLALLFHVATTAAQQPPAPKGSIEGVVVRAGSGQPIAGARVTATRQPAGRGGPPTTAPVQPADVLAIARGLGTAPPSSPSATTDNAGRFVVQGLDEAAYSLLVQGNGYVQQNYGQQFAGGPGRPINVTAGQQVKDIAISLTPTGNVSGRIHDTSDQPLANVPVQLLRYSYNASGQRTFQPVGSVSTDDRGEYRIYWVTPGRYYLMAGKPPSSADSILAMVGPMLGGATNASGNPVQVPNDYAYYPGVKDIAAARSIDVQPAAEVQAIDISLSQKPRTYRVRGFVIDGRTGQPPAHASVAALPRTASVEVAALAAGSDDLGLRYYNPAKGTFELRDLLPGSYVVSASIQTGQGGAVTFPQMGKSTASTTVTITDSDIDGIGITVAPAASVSGRLRYEGQAPRSTGDFIPFQLVTLNSSPLDIRTQLLGMRFVATPPGNTDGTFRVDNVSPGEYRVAMLASGGGNYIKEARFGGVDIVNAPLRFSGSTGETLDILVGTARGQVSGVVADARSQPAPGMRVVLVPDQNRDRTELFRVVTSDQNGRFSMPGVPPGDYKVFSWEAVEQYAWFDPDLLTQFEGAARAVHVTDSSAETVEVRLIPAGGAR